MEVTGESNLFLQASLVPLKPEALSISSTGLVGHESDENDNDLVKRQILPVAKDSRFHSMSSRKSCLYFDIVTDVATTSHHIKQENISFKEPFDYQAVTLDQRPDQKTHVQSETFFKGEQNDMGSSRRHEMMTWKKTKVDEYQWTIFDDDSEAHKPYKVASLVRTVPSQAQRSKDTSNRGLEYGCKRSESIALKRSAKPCSENSSADIAHESSNLFSYAQCYDIFSNRQTLERHMGEVHKDVMMFSCSLCHYKCRRKSNMKQHILTIHQGLRKYLCNHCGYKCTRSSQLKQHIQAIHQGLKLHTCSHCEYKCSYKGNLKRHILTVHDRFKKHSCSICKYKSSQLSCLKIHMEAVHQGLKKYSCRHCVYKCSRKGNLKKHTEAIHQRLNKYQCSHCVYKCSQKGDLKKHIEVIHQSIKNYSCNHCEYKCTRKESLKKHIEAVHQGLKKALR